MAQKLKNMKLTSVDLVKRGANQKADIRLCKSASQDPTDEEKNIFKRFLDWLYESTASNEALEGMKEAPIEKGDESADVYKSAITESIQSIIADESLSAEEKNDMVEKSLEQYHDAMMELAKSPTGEQEEIPEPEEDPEEPTEEPTEPDYEDIEEVESPVKKK